MGTKYLRVPRSLQPSVDALVGAARKGEHRPSGQAFVELTRWCEENDDASGLQSGEFGGGFLVVALEPWLVDDVEDGVDIESVTRASAEAGLAAAVREHLYALLEGDGDIDPFPHACGIRLKATNGESAVLTYFLSAGGYMGDLNVSWHGVYPTFKEFRAEIRASGGLTSKTDVRRLPKPVLIDLVRRHATARSRPSAEREVG